jgi:hypothetical protein
MMVVEIATAWDTLKNRFIDKSIFSSPASLLEGIKAPVFEEASPTTQFWC